MKTVKESSAKSIFLKKILNYGLPALAVVLVMAVAAGSLLTGQSTSNIVFGKIAKDAQAEVKGDLSEITNQEKLNQNDKQDMAEVRQQIKEDLVSTSLSNLVDKENTLAVQKNETVIETVKEVEQEKEELLTIKEIKAQVQEKPVAEVNVVVEQTPAPSPVVSEVTTDIPEETIDSKPDTTEAQVPDPSPEFILTGLDKYVNAEVLNMRSTPDFNAEVVNTLAMGDLVTEVSANHEWSKIISRTGEEAYVYNYYLTTDVVQAPVVEEVQEETVKASSFEAISATKYIGVGAANVRAAANTSSEILNTLYYGQAVELTGYTSDWYQVAGSGYIRGDLLRNDPVPQEELDALNAVAESTLANEEAVVEEVSAPQETVTPGHSGGSAAISIALAQVGKPYVWGASGPNSFDCSGLVQYAVVNAGGSISRTSYTQANDGIAVSFSPGNYANLVPGDVLAFAYGGSISHTGLYIGNGEFVHAANPSEGVIISSLYGYWGNGLAYVRRVFY